MDTQILNQLVTLLREALEWLQKLYQALEARLCLPCPAGLPPLTAASAADGAVCGSTVSGFPDDAAIRKAYRDMLNRDRVRRWREKNRKAQETPAACKAPAVYDVPVNAPAVSNAQAFCHTPAVSNAPVNTPTVPDTPVTCNAQAETGAGSITEMPCNASAKKEKENEKRKNQRKEINKNKKNHIADAMPKGAREAETGKIITGPLPDKLPASAGMNTEPVKSSAVSAGSNAVSVKSNTASAGSNTDSAKSNTVSGKNNTASGQNNTVSPGFANPDGSCLPYVPLLQRTEMIPTEKLPPSCRKLVLAWNQLPLSRKLRGLYPSLVHKLNRLLVRYGEEKLLQAIGMVGESPFLLGKSRNSRGWVIHFDWMLDPVNLEKILHGQYMDRSPDGGSGWHGLLFQPGDEARPYDDGFMGTVV